MEQVERGAALQEPGSACDLVPVETIEDAREMHHLLHDIGAESGLCRDVRNLSCRDHAGSSTLPASNSSGMMSAQRATSRPRRRRSI